MYITQGTGYSEVKLSGTTAVQVADGVARFSDLSIDKAGSGYTLTAKAQGAIPGTSDPFNVTGMPFSITFTTPPSGAVAGSAFFPSNRC